MSMFIFQTLLLVAIAFFLGCLLGAFFRRQLGSNQSTTMKAETENSIGTTEPTMVAAPETVTAPNEAIEPVASVPPEIPDKPPITEPVAKLATEKSHRDNLKRIKGIGKKIESQLNGIGITTFEQVAVWTNEDIEKISDQLAFKGRIGRENWVGQAQNFAKLSNILDEPLQPIGINDTGKSQTPTKESPEGPGKKPAMLKKARQGGPDTLTLIDGIGPALETKLFGLGIYHLNQIAKWDDEHETWIGAQIGFPGRSQRENWVGEAKKLVESGTTRSNKSMDRNGSQGGKTKIL